MIERMYFKPMACRHTQAICTKNSTINRYLSSFILSSTIYFTAILTLFYFLRSESCEANSKIESTKVVKISLLDLHKESKQELHEEKPPQIPQPIQEIKKEPIAKTEPKKIVKTVPLPHAKSIEKVASKEETKQAQFSKEENSVEQTIAKTHNDENSMEKKAIEQAKLEERQMNFFVKLRELINQNKSYPSSARRRGVQGDIQVKFSVLEDGNVKNIELISGQAIFESSALEAIQKSFPIEVDKTLFTFPKEFKITIAYILN
jgi:protein TonB